MENGKDFTVKMNCSLGRITSNSIHNCSRTRSVLHQSQDWTLELRGRIHGPVRGLVNSSILFSNGKLRLVARCSIAWGLEPWGSWIILV